MGNKIVGEDRDNSEKKPYRWLMYHSLLVWLGSLLTIILVLISVLIGFGESIAVFVWLPIGLLAAFTGIVSLWAFYGDSKYLKNQESDYSPLWPLWTLGALLIGVPFIAPLYLIRRRTAVGAADYTGTWLEPVFER